MTAKLKIRWYFPLTHIYTYIRMTVPYRTAKFESANIFISMGSGPNCQIERPPIYSTTHQNTRNFSITEKNLARPNLEHKTSEKNDSENTMLNKCYSPWSLKLKLTNYSLYRSLAADCQEWSTHLYLYSLAHLITSMHLHAVLMWHRLNTDVSALTYWNMFSQRMITTFSDGLDDNLGWLVSSVMAYTQYYIR